MSKSVTSETPAVSVLVPCYNKVKYIEETLASVWAQSFASWELIVVDDGSTDGSAALLERALSRDRERLTVELGPNRGVSAARQRALELCRGQYVQYLDADDLLLPDALARSVHALETSGADVAYGDWQRLVMNSDGSFSRGEVIRRRMDAVDEDPEVACFTTFWSPPAALLYRRALLQRMPPWNPALPVIQDARYLQEAAFAGARFAHVPEVLALYREDGGNSLSKRSRVAFARDCYVNACEVEAIWRARSGLRPARKRALGDAFGSAARLAFREDDALFDACVERMAALGELRALSWSRIAGSLRTLIGRERALYVLERLRKPAS